MNHFNTALSAIALALALPTLCPANVLYNSLSPADTYNDGTGTGIQKYGTTTQVYAEAFTPPTGSNYNLTQLDLAVTYESYAGGTSQAVVYLLADSAGIPDFSPAIASWNISAEPLFGSAHTITASQTITGITGITLTGNTQYWIAVGTAADSSSLVWNNDNYPTSGSGAATTTQYSANAGLNWTPTAGGDGPGLKVLGDIIAPEPASLLLLAPALTLLRRRRPVPQD